MFTRYVGDQNDGMDMGHSYGLPAKTCQVFCNKLTDQYIITRERWSRQGNYS